VLERSSLFDSCRRNLVDGTNVPTTSNHTYRWILETTLKKTSPETQPIC
jgi:hypothetical protein